MQESETPSNDAEQLYTRFVLGGCQQKVLQEAEVSCLHSIADMLGDSRLWSMLNIAQPSAFATKEELVHRISDITIAALNGDRTFGAEVADAKHIKVQHTNKFRLREAELSKPGDQDPHEYTPKEFRQIIRQGTTRIIFGLQDKQKKQGWIAVTDFLREYLHQDTSPENIRALSLLLKTYFGNPLASFVIDDKTYYARGLVDYRRNVKAHSYFINPIAAPLILEKMKTVPMLLDDKKREQWVSSTEMALRIYGSTSSEDIASLDMVAEKLLAKHEIDISTAESSMLCAPTDIVGLYRNRGTPPTYYFDPSKQEYFEKCVGIARQLPENKNYFISEDTLQEQAGLTRIAARSAIKDIVAQLRHEDHIYIFDDKGKPKAAGEPSDCIIRVVPSGKRTKYYIDPFVAELYFSPDQLRFHAPKEADVGEALTIAPANWYSFSTMMRKTGLRSEEDKPILKEYLRFLRDELHHPLMGYFPSRAASGQAAYYADPAIVGRDKLIGRESVYQFREQLLASGLEA